MPKRKRKKYKKPKRIFSRERIEEENNLVKKYGLKNKREIWKAEARIDKIRKRAKSLLTKSEENKKIFIEKLKKQGFAVESIADILALNKEDYLKRRLQSVVVRKKLASTPKHARQLIVHKHIAINGKIVNKPSYLVKIDEEDKISLIKKSKLKEEPIEKKVEEVIEDKGEKNA